MPALIHQDHMRDATVIENLSHEPFRGFMHDLVRSPCNGRNVIAGLLVRDYITLRVRDARHAWNKIASPCFLAFSLSRLLLLQICKCEHTAPQFIDSPAVINVGRS
jgi:hypothetical protein